jgi:hypothetical protein
VTKKPWPDPLPDEEIAVCDHVAQGERGVAGEALAPTSIIPGADVRHFYGCRVCIARFSRHERFAPHEVCYTLARHFPYLFPAAAETPAELLIENETTELPS